MAYQPKYITESDVPVQIPDDYSSKEKLDAIEVAESSAELDLNAGDPLPQELQVDAVRAAIKQKATCELAKGAEDEDDAALTDLSSTGANKADYAENAFCERYEQMITRIQQSELLGEDEEQSLSQYVYNT